MRKRNIVRWIRPIQPRERIPLVCGCLMIFISIVLFRVGRPELANLVLMVAAITLLRPRKGKGGRSK